MLETDNALGVFLRAWRRRADPGAFGLPEHPPRRGPGLRREELAFLAGVSSHYYARLEQGRDRNPSPAVLDALARVLGLDETAADHLRQLAHQEPRRRRRSRAEQVSPGMLDLVRRWTIEPAIVVGRWRDVLASNPVARLVNAGWAPGRNLLRETFLDAGARDRYPDWTEIATGAVAELRAYSVDELDDPRLTELVGELSVKSEDFRKLWARHDVRVRDTGVKRFRTPLAGEMTLGYEALAVLGSPGQTLYVFTAEPGSEDEHKLRMLAALGEG